MINLSVDSKLKKLGFTKTSENRYGASYRRICENYNCMQCVDILRKSINNKEYCIFQSYNTQPSTKDIRSTSVGLKLKELTLFTKKMKQLIRKQQ